MRNAAALVCFLVLVLGFGDADTWRPRRVKAFAPRSLAAPLLQVAVPLGLQVISVGDVVGGTLMGETITRSPDGQLIFVPAVTEILYELTAPSDGTLIVTLDRDPSSEFIGLSGPRALSYFSFGANTVATLPVTAGGTYRFSVFASTGSFYYYYEFLGPVPFVLTTSLEPCRNRPPALGWVCVNGGAGWVPAGHPLAAPAPPPSPLTPTSLDAVGCPSIRPGADWICANGNWLPPGHPLALTAQPNPAPPSSPAAPASTCTGPDPFVGIPGLSGVCVNGGWVPIGHPLARGGG
jgi:hypothetical protein